MKTSEIIIYDYCANSILGLTLDSLRVRAALTQHWELTIKGSENPEQQRVQASHVLMRCASTTA